MKRWITGMLIAGALLGQLGSGGGAASQVAAQAASKFPPIRLLNSKRAVDPSANDRETGRCLSSAFRAPGQSWDSNRSAGGLTQQAVVNTDPAERGKALGAQLTPSGQVVRVTILIVDHFEPETIVLKENGVQTTYQLSHGNLVTEHLRAVLRGAGYVQASQNEFRKGAYTVSLLAVQVDQLNTRQVVSRLTTTIKRNELRDNFVINMSLAMLPCGVEADYQQSKQGLNAANGQLYTLNKYLSDLYAGNPQLAAQGISLFSFEQQLLNPPNLSPQEPLRAFVTGMHGSYPQAVFVASSGNYGLPFSTMPAAWREVVSVGASDLIGLSKPVGHRARVPALGGPPVPAPVEWPDRGDVMEVGQWLHLDPAALRADCAPTDPACALPGLPLSSPVFDAFKYRGTSFSAPTVSAYVAMAMQAAGPKCVPPNAPLPPNNFAAAWPKLPAAEPNLKPRLLALGCP
ncbi:S8 family serine peptidase [Deinococcus sp.]|uniref:S8 family serine peptidase n=1 Tax=Deinococcus sp. TaxID=47478 RepID=UPI003CC6D114